MEIEVSTRDIATFKRKWKDQYKEVIYSDEMSKEENALFKNDATLIRLIEKCKRAEMAVIEHMNGKIELSREETQKILKDLQTEGNFKKTKQQDEV